MRFKDLCTHRARQTAKASLYKKVMFMCEIVIFGIDFDRMRSYDCGWKSGTGRVCLPGVWTSGCLVVSSGVVNLGLRKTGSVKATLKEEWMQEGWSMERCVPLWTVRRCQRKRIWPNTEGCLFLHWCKVVKVGYVKRSIVVE